ncbi:hypothetical protein NHQ30_004277 [Ciborinia camelliae]|nr:hypothetical protein NHQ30_004277 [Ciborinia camelliae]
MGSIPLAAVVVVTVAPCLLALIIIGSATALNDILSLVLAGLFSSYFMAAALLLYHRVNKNIKTSSEDISEIISPVGRLTWGPWRINGVFGIANNIFACVFLVIITFFSFFPPTAKVTPATMNYSVLVFGSVVLFSIIYYVAYARKFYTGPVVEI